MYLRILRSDHLNPKFGSQKSALFDLKAKIITIFTFLIITNFKTDKYLNNFQEHLFGILRLRKYKTSTSKFLSHVRTRLELTTPLLKTDHCSSLG